MFPTVAPTEEKNLRILSALRPLPRAPCPAPDAPRIFPVHVDEGAPNVIHQAVETPARQLRDAPLGGFLHDLAGPTGDRLGERQPQGTRVGKHAARVVKELMVEKMMKISIYILLNFYIILYLMTSYDRSSPAPTSSSIIIINSIPCYCWLLLTTIIDRY